MPYPMDRATALGYFQKTRAQFAMMHALLHKLPNIPLPPREELDALLKNGIVELLDDGVAPYRLAKTGKMEADAIEILSPNDED